MDKLQKEALDFHSQNPKGKITTKLADKLLNINKYKLSLAYSPGVAEPCKEIYNDYEKIYDYTSKGNFVAVISNGTAVLGLGNLGAAASKPVMEGKAVLFKRFADIDSIDIEVDETNPQKFVDIVRKIAVSWGGINLEDIKAPECFIIEDELNNELDIPVFHDDQHGTAIVTVAGLINAAYITDKKIENVVEEPVKVVKLPEKIEEKTIVKTEAKPVQVLKKEPEKKRQKQNSKGKNSKTPTPVIRPVRTKKERKEKTVNSEIPKVKKSRQDAAEKHQKKQVKKKTVQKEQKVYHLDAISRSS